MDLSQESGVYSLVSVCAWHQWDVSASWPQLASVGKLGVCPNIPTPWKQWLFEVCFDLAQFDLYNLIQFNTKNNKWCKILTASYTCHKCVKDSWRGILLFLTNCPLLFLVSCFPDYLPPSVNSTYLVCISGVLFIFQISALCLICALWFFCLFGWFLQLAFCLR